MFSPIKWLRPRLKQFCIAFGAADMTLILLSIICWYFFFDILSEAQYNRPLLMNEKPYDNKEKDIFNPNPLFKLKENRTTEELRLDRTKRACEIYDKTAHLRIEQDLTGPAGLIGASMGSYFILGALLTSFGIVEWHAGLKVLCIVCVFGEGVSTLFLVAAVTSIFSNEGLCPTEYYFEGFQPIIHLYVFTLIFVCCYKIYEVTVITLYLADEARRVRREKRKTEAEKRSSFVHAHDQAHTEKLQKAYEASTSNPSQESKSCQAETDAEPSSVPSQASCNQSQSDQAEKESEFETISESGGTSAQGEVERKKCRNKKNCRSKGLPGRGKCRSKQSLGVGTSSPNLSTKEAQTCNKKRMKDANEQCEGYETVSEEVGTLTRGCTPKKRLCKKKSTGKVSTGTGTCCVKRLTKSYSRRSCCVGGDVPLPVHPPPCDRSNKAAYSCLCHSLLTGEALAVPQPQIIQPAICEADASREIKYCVRVQVETNDSCVEISPKQRCCSEANEKRKSQ